MESNQQQNSLEIPAAGDAERLRKSWARLNIAQNSSIPLGNAESYDSCDTLSQHLSPDER